ncbi:MAG: hypothetical protein ABSE99_07795 [Terracidiphilus sp.]
MIPALVAVKRLQALAQTSCLHANNRVFRWLKVGWTAKRLDRNGVFLDLIGPALKVLLADVAQKAGECWRSLQVSRSQRGLQFGSHLHKCRRGGGLLQFGKTPEAVDESGSQTNR